MANEYDDFFLFLFPFFFFNSNKLWCVNVKEKNRFNHLTICICIGEKILFFFFFQNLALRECTIKKKKHENLELGIRIIWQRWKITCEFVRDNLDKLWIRYYRLFQCPNITLNILYGKSIDKNYWSFRNAQNCLVFFWKFIGKHNDLRWDYENLSNKEYTMAPWHIDIAKIWNFVVQKTECISSTPYFVWLRTIGSDAIFYQNLPK